MLLADRKAVRSLGVLSLCLATLCNAAGHGRELGGDLDRVNIGNFRVPIHDSRLPVEQGRRNHSDLQPALGLLFQKVLDYYSSYSDAEMPPEADQLSNVTSFAKDILLDRDFSQYNQGLINQTVDTAKIDFTPDVLKEEELPHPDLVYEYLNAIFNLSTSTWWNSQGAYVGVGWESECAASISDVLAEKDEWEKIGSNAATTLMALVPTILAFGHLYVPRSSEAYTTSALVGLATSFYTLGLPSHSMSAVKQSNVHTLALFGIVTLTAIGSLGMLNRSGQPKAEPELKELQEWSRSGSGDEIKERFASIRENANSWDRRWHLWYMPSLFVAACQTVIFALAIYPLFRDLGVPKFILSCDVGNRQDWTAKYIGVSAAINTLVRYIKWENSSHERVKIYPLSDASLDALRDIVRKTGQLPNSITTAIELPPLLPPVLLRLKGFWNSTWRKCTSIFHSKSTASQSSLPTVNASVPQSNVKIHILIASQLKYMWRQIAYTFTKQNFVAIFKSGFGSQVPASARRWRPIYLLIHMSTEGRNPLMTLLTGFIEAGLLLILSFFFAAQWGGNLLITGVALALLLLFITIGRALGLIYVWVSSQVWGLTVINCDSAAEIRGTLRIVCSMQDVLVHVNGATYFDGYRMDGRDGWKDFLEHYERGMFDYNGPSRKNSVNNSQHSPITPEGSSVTEENKNVTQVAVAPTVV